MKISTRGRYGLRALVDLASAGDECKNLKSIAKSQGLSEAYLEQLFAPLKKAGFIQSIRGAQGGYRLSRLPEEITAGDILRVLEGPMYPVSCVQDQENAQCGTSHCQVCAAKDLWTKIYDSVKEVLESVTLADLAQNYNDLLLQYNLDEQEDNNERHIF